MKLFGLALYMGNWPAFCFGKKAWNPFRFFGIMIHPRENIYDLED